MSAAGPRFVVDSVHATENAHRAPRQERRWAPGLDRMVVYTAAMTASALVLQFNALAPEAWHPFLLFGAPALVILFGLLAHRSYVKAREALRSDATLAGARIVQNAWWVAAAVLLAPSILGLLVVFLLST